MIPLTVDGIGVCAGGLPDWPAARAVLRGEVPFAAAPPPRLTAAGLPATERRRANDTARWALQVAAEAVRDVPAGRVATLPTVFASSDGDGEVLAQVLHDLAADKVTLSPTTFHNSVFNAPAGYWSIAAQSPAPSTTVCAAEASLAAGLLEAAAQVEETAVPVLLVACDLPFPARSPLGTTTRAAFSCALLLAPAAAARAPLGVIGRIDFASGPAAGLPDALAASFGGNAAASALSLLHAAARGRAAAVTLPYLDGGHLALEWTPCG